MSNVIPFPVKPTTDVYFGGCPKCGKSDRCMNVGPDHWFVCHQHNAAWLIGSNLFSGWKNEPAELHAANARKISTMTVVAPIYPAGRNNGAGA